ncbi:hypothetical protein MKK88_21115 [Methylobacterium sp. E-005]|uniref:hypothetical protein n=1 Tax=Methylobacterium sp. E-005 TaxID=2836549 RepID=UPI001FB90805|nr:hypothetical protein [Methylobacterium sp. E-005]MCJ2088461.1 hypothetical protein [Methylobacterium sp. E-005]
MLPTKPLEVPTAAVFPAVRAVLWRPAFYRSHLGARVNVFPGNVELPEPVAQTAFGAGHAFEPRSAAGQAIERLIRMDPNARIEVTNGVPRAVKFTGALGEGGKGLPPALDPVNLGMLPDCFGVILPEAAQ